MIKTKTLSSKLTRTILGAAMAGLSATAAVADVSQLIVVRASDDSLWKATCSGTTCSGFTNFPGRFGYQPTVFWDEYLGRYVLWGAASNGTIWRSTFTPDGAFNNDWTNIPGLTSSPPGGGAGGFTRAWNSNFPGGDTILTNAASGVVTSVKSLAVTPAFSTGYFQCTATGQITIERANTAGTNVVFVGLSIVNNTTDRWVAVELPDTTPVGMTSIPFAVTSWFSNGVSTSRTFYLNAYWQGTSSTDTIRVRQTSMYCDYHTRTDG